MTRYRATIAYDGTNFYGFQKQAHERTVQGEIEVVLANLMGHAVPIVGAGRTDTGVHATGQVIAFDADWAHGESALIRAINHALPNDVAISNIVQHAGFHPRYHALSRVYRYDVLVAPIRQPLVERYVWHITQALDEDLLAQVAHLLIGTHDFATFGNPPKGDNTVRQVFASFWQQHHSPYGTLWSYTVEATAFLHHQVRRMVGMMVDVGRQHGQVEQFATAFRRANLKDAGKLAPPQGLVLVEVRYPPPDQLQHNGMDYGGVSYPSEVLDES